MADDLGWAELGCYGQKKIKTPNLDKMAAEGVRFTNFYSGSPVCAPSRCTLLTGKHTGHAQIRQNREMGGYADSEEHGQSPIKANTFTIGAMLKSQGYTTACIGKWGLGGPNTEGVPRKNGFDYFYGYLDQKQAHNLYPTHLWHNETWDTLQNSFINSHPKLTDAEKTDPNIYKKFMGNDFAPYHIRDEAVKFIQNNKNKPFFLYFTPVAPHLSLQIPDREIDKFGYNFNDTPYLANKGYTPHNRPKAAYAASISLLDEMVGNILETLKKEGLEENTLIIFTSDNGATFDVGGVDAAFFESVKDLRGLKGSIYEGGIRVPFIVKYGKKLKPNSIIPNPAVNYDIMATIKDFTKNQTKFETDGISLMPLILGGKANDNRTLYWEFAGYGHQKAVRMGNWKGVYVGLEKNPNALLQLYDLEKDESEQNDVAAKYPEIAEKIKKIMLESHSESEIKAWNF